MLKFFKKRWYLVLIVILIVGFIYYKNTQATAAANKVNSYTVKKQNLKDTLTLSGQIDADEKVALKFQTSGRLSWVGVKEGDYVKKYQTIASLDQRDVKNRMQKYLNTFVNTRLGFDQTKDDSIDKQNDMSETVRESAERALQESQNTLNNSILDVELQNLSIEYSNLWTPIDGVVTSVTAPFAGVNVTPTGAEFDIVNPQTMYFSATADQTDIINLKDGMIGKVSFDAYPEKTFEGELYYTGFVPKSGETGTVYELRFKLDKAAMELPLKMGMTADLDIDLRVENNVLSVPSAFLKKDGKGDYVTKKQNSKNVKIYVNTGDEINGNIIIDSGLSVGDVIYD